MSAEALKEISPHQFEWWAVVARPSWPWARFTGETPVLHARPAKDHKKGADIRRLTDYINPSAGSGR